MNNKVVYLHKDKEGIVRYVGSGSMRRALITTINSGRGKTYDEFITKFGKMDVEIIKVGLSIKESIEFEKELYFKHIETIFNMKLPNSEKVISKADFDSFVYYDETSSTCLRWKINIPYARIKVNDEAGSFRKQTGYSVVMINKVTHFIHRVVAALHDIDVSGYVIDHIDGDRSNNRVGNLRAVSQSENQHNRKKSKNNKTGITGVQFNDASSSWVASWYVDGKQKRKYFKITDFDSSDDAFNAAKECRILNINLHYNLMKDGNEYGI